MGSNLNLAETATEELSQPSSQFRNSSSEPPVGFHFPDDLIFVAVTVCTVLILIGVIGNFLTIAALTKCRKLRSSTTVLVINLSAADLFFCGCVMPLRVFMLIRIENKIDCTVFLPLFYGNATVSLVTMVAIALNRYLLVLHNHIHRRIFTKNGTCIVILLVWIYSFIVWCIPMLTSWGHFQFLPGTPFCQMAEDSKSPKLFFGCFGFVLPCIAITVGYIAIFFTVKKSDLRISSHQTNHQPSHIAFTRVLLIAYCSFMAFFLPNFIILMIHKTRENPIALTIGEMLLWLSSCSNPIVYVLCSRHYRQAYKVILTFSRAEDQLGENASKPEVSLCRVPNKRLEELSRDFTENFSSTAPSSS